MNPGNPTETVPAEQLEPTSADRLTAEVERRIAAMRERQQAASPPPVASEGEDSSPPPAKRRFRAACATCGEDFDAVEYILFGKVALRKSHCDPCVERHNEEERAISLTGKPDREDEWRALCPAEFRTTAEGGATVLPRLLRECPKLAEVTGWTYGPKGMLIRGDTGRCKTRAVWRLLRELFAQGWSIVALTSGEFARQFADAAGNFTRSAWFSRMAGADVLFLDDLGKGRWTEGVWGEFFELVDDRTKHSRPVILTTNDTCATMAGKCTDPVTWGPLDRRLRDYCELLVL